MPIIEIGQKKVINGNVYLKVPETAMCDGCAFEDDRCPGHVWDASVEDGGSECHGTVWVSLKEQPKPSERTVTLEFIKGPATCDNCAFGSPYVKGCPALQNGDTSLDCASEGYWRVKAGA